MQIRVKIQGTRPILFHSGALADPQNQFARALAKVSKKRAKTDADFAEMAKLEFLGSFDGYVDEKGNIVVPEANLLAVIVKGASKTKKGPTAKAGVLGTVNGVDGKFNFPHKGDKSPEALWESGKFADRRRVRVQQSSNMRTRPKFPEWSCEFELEVDEDACDLEDVRQWLETAGKSVGLGDYRPMFGRFDVVEFKEVKSG